MVRQDAEIAVTARRFGIGHLLADEQAIGGCDFEFEGGRHMLYFTFFISAAVSRTSSMVPCM